MVTQISNSIVRTTHLTGLFTDLGIELQLFFIKKPNDEKVECSIYLGYRLLFFFYWLYL
jgi:hypothetical protein